MADNNVEGVGNLTAKPILRPATNGGKNRATFTVAIKDGKDGEKTIFTNWTAFGSLAENAVESLDKGSRVLVKGRLDSYQKEVVINGETKNLTMISFVADSIGPELRFAQATIVKAARADAPAGAGATGDSDSDF